jgi:hypothetical protein
MVLKEGNTGGGFGVRGELYPKDFSSASPQCLELFGDGAGEGLPPGEFEIADFRTQAGRQSKSRIDCCFD